MRLKKRGLTLSAGANTCPGALLSDGTIPVHTAAFKEAVLDHTVAKQKEEDC
jgi:hypothetical protein